MLSVNASIRGTVPGTVPGYRRAAGRRVHHSTVAYPNPRGLLLFWVTSLSGQETRVRVSFSNLTSIEFKLEYPHGAGGALSPGGAHKPGQFLKTST